MSWEGSKGQGHGSASSVSRERSDLRGEWVSDQRSDVRGQTSAVRVQRSAVRPMGQESVSAVRRERSNVRSGIRVKGQRLGQESEIIGQ